MAKVVPFRWRPARERTPSVHDARKLVQLLAQDSKKVFVSKHAMERQQKHGISLRQIMTCLRKGVVTEGPYRNQYGNWQVNVSRLAAGEEITCTVVIEEEDQGLVVRTVFPG